MPTRGAASATCPPRRHAPPAERKAQIVEAGLRCFSERGYHATTMDHLAIASGLSKGSLYWHFEGKEEVFLAVFDFLAEKVFGRVDAAQAAGDVPVLDVLRSEIARFLEEFGAERALLLAWAEFLSHPRGRERLAEIYRRSRETFAALVGSGIERGELRDLPVESIAAAVTGLLDALLLQAVLDPRFDPSEHVEAVCEILTRGVAR